MTTPFLPADRCPARTASPNAPAWFDASDLGAGERLAHVHGADLRYSHSRERWYVWDGRRWAEDDTGEVERRAKDAALRVYLEAAAASKAGATDDADRLTKAIPRLRESGRLRAAIGLARSEWPIPVATGSFDTDPYLLNTPAGTVDLRTGTLSAHRREDLLTHLTNGAPDADMLQAAVGAPYAACPWRRVLERVLPDEDVRTFWWRLIGLSLIGRVVEHILPILHGAGGNGKTTVVEAVEHALGDYAQVAPAQLLLTGRSTDGPSPEILRLKGARLVVASETAMGRRLDEATVKQLTGGDRLVARMPYGRDFEEFAPTHTVMLHTNHEPIVRGTDEGIWRRLLKVPFTITISDQERESVGDLEAQLQAEADGILAWAIAGTLDYARNGLPRPAAVADATRSYRAEQDLIGAWLDEATVRVPGGWAESSVLYRSYSDHCTQAGEKPLSQRALSLELQRLGYEKDHDSHTRRAIYRGIGLATDPDRTP